MVKPLIRQSETPDGILITDDSISEKPYTDENDIICRHYDRCSGRNVKADEVMCGTDTPIKIFPEQADFPLFFIRQVFADRDGSEGVPYPVTDDTALSYGQITAVCRKRRNAECYLRSLKQNASPEKL